MKLLSTVVLILTMVVVLGCPGPRLVTPQPLAITDQKLCQSACDNLTRLNCEEAKPIEMKTTCSVDNNCDRGTCVSGKCYTNCVTFCIDTENAGVWLDPNCVAHMSSCDQIESCPIAQPKQIVK